jgi:hypothetical protein
MVDVLRKQDRRRQLQGGMLAPSFYLFKRDQHGDGRHTAVDLARVDSRKTDVLEKRVQRRSDAPTACDA